MSVIRRRFPALRGLSVALCGVLVGGPALLLAGCAQKDAPPPASSGYYTGPLKKKGTGGPAPSTPTKHAISTSD